MNYINDCHWIWYSLGFLFTPRLTIMVALSIYLKDFIPSPLMIIGWIFAILSLFKVGTK